MKEICGRIKLKVNEKELGGFYGREKLCWIDREICNLSQIYKVHQQQAGITIITIYL
jgi:hypothetical protein